ncbi:MAG: rhodanese-like domain-containing protein [Myxococcota bacterium]|nr:rhodanese-like domain-containing protein [Myxococcota bacterium]
MRIPEITPEQTHARIQAGEEICILDCREGFELALAKLPFKVLHIPLMQLEDYEDQLPRDRQIVVMCHHGVRSLTGAMWLREWGLEAVSMKGGIDRWAIQVDGSVGRY